MIVLEPDDLEHGIVVNATQALGNDQYYAMVDSGTIAIIVPLHPGMKREIAECQAPSATRTGPIVQVYSHNGAKRLVVALPNSAKSLLALSLSTFGHFGYFGTCTRPTGLQDKKSEASLLRLEVSGMTTCQTKRVNTKGKEKTKPRTIKVTEKRLKCVF